MQAPGAIIPANMRALVLETPGIPPSLAVREVPTPTPAAGEVLVRVKACGFCHHDLLVMAGVLRRGVRPGVVLGHEIAGEVVQVGPEVTSLQPGDQVVSLLTNACGRCHRCRQGREHRCLRGEGIGHRRDGGFAEYVALSEFSLLPIPMGITSSDAESALLACPIGVVVQAIQRVAQLESGESLLVTGAGGGLGVHAVQLGASLGARVLAVTSSPEKVAALEELGASAVLEAGDAAANGGTGVDFSELALAMTDGQGVDVVLDTVGSARFPSAWRCLSQYGRLVLLGEVTGGPVELNLAEVIFRDARLLGSSGVSRSMVQRAGELVGQGRLKPVVDRVLTLEEAATAFELLSSRQVLGRLVLTSQ